MTLLVRGGGYFEGPRWHEGQWWVSDFQRCGLFTVSAAGREDLIVTVPGQSSGLGWLPDGSMLIVSMKDRRLLRRNPQGKLEEYADLTAYGHGHINDMVVDPSGQAYVGQFGFDIDGHAKPAKTTLIKVAPDRSVSVVADELFFPQWHGDNPRWFHADRGRGIGRLLHRILHRR